MAVDFDTAYTLKKEYEDIYETRHQAFEDLRRFWQGDYWKIAQQAKTARSIVSVFRDMVHSGSETLPDMKLVKNVVQKICVKYQTFLSPLPMISVYVDPPGTENKRRQATVKERYLYGVWNDTRMIRTFNRLGWYLPLFGDAFHGCMPDFDACLPRSVLRSPECAYPVPNFDGSGSEVFIFAWKERQSVLQRQFPNWTPPQKGRLRPLIGGQLRGGDPDPEFEIIEWSDDNEFHRWVGGQEMNGVEHGFGFNLFEHVKFIDVPDEPWGHGAVEQIVNQNEALNALQSLLFQAVLENVFPSLVLIDPAKAPEEIYRGPGSVIPINAGGDVKAIAPPVQALPAQLGFMGAVEHGMKEDAGLNETSFGVSPASSIVTGQAIEDLQNAGTASTVEMVQSTGIGSAITRWNAQAIFIGQTMFASDTINLYGLRSGGIGDIAPKAFAESIKGKQLVGSGRNEVVFMPQYDLHTKVVIGLQMAGGGLVSKKWQRQNAGIPDSDAMDEEILDEAIENAVIGAILGELQAAPTPQSAAGVEEQAVAYINGGGTRQPPAAAPPGPPPAAALAGPAQLPHPTPHPLLGAGAGAPPAPPSAPMAAPAPPPPPSLTGPSGPAAGLIRLADAQAAIQAIKGIQGRVFLVGAIVQRGQTQPPVEIAVTVKSDGQLIQSQVPFPVQVLVIAGEPQERFVEVTPGREATPGGGGQSSPEALQGVFPQ